MYEYTRLIETLLLEGKLEYLTIKLLEGDLLGAHFFFKQLCLLFELLFLLLQLVLAVVHFVECLSCV